MGMDHIGVLDDRAHLALGATSEPLRQRFRVDAAALDIPQLPGHGKCRILRGRRCAGFECSQQRNTMPLARLFSGQFRRHLRRTPVAWIQRLDEMNDAHDWLEIRVCYARGALLCMPASIRGARELPRAAVLTAWANRSIMLAIE